MRSLKYLLPLIPILLTARAAQSESADAKERAARLACLSGDYTKGVAILSKLFVDQKDPTYIYNQGRCYEQSMRYQEAIGRFQEYLRAAKKASKSDKADAEKHIADCQDLLAKQQSQAVAAPAAAPSQAPVVAPAPPVAIAVPTPPVPVAAPTPPMVQQAARQPANESGSGMRTAGIITAAVGGAALVAGVVFNLKVNSIANDLQKTNGYDAGKVSDRNSFETMGWVSYGVGAACVVTGAVLYILGLRSGAHESASVALVPALAPGQAGAVLKGAF